MLSTTDCSILYSLRICFQNSAYWGQSSECKSAMLPADYELINQEGGQGFNNFPPVISDLMGQPLIVPVESQYLQDNQQIYLSQNLLSLNGITIGVGDTALQFNNMASGMLCSGSLNEVNESEEASPSVSPAPSLATLGSPLSVSSQGSWSSTDSSGWSSNTGKSSSDTAGSSSDTAGSSSSEVGGSLSKTPLSGRLKMHERPLTGDPEEDRKTIRSQKERERREKRKEKLNELLPEQV